MNQNIYYKELERLLTVTGSFDVVVIGGGFAGVSAALAASRNKRKVCLIEKTCSPGGLGTLGLVVDYLPLCDGFGVQMTGGVAEELMRGVSIYDASSPADIWNDSFRQIEKDKSSCDGQTIPRYELTYNPSAMILFMEELLLKEEVTIFYDTLFCDVLKSGHTIDAVIIENKGGRSVVKGKYFIDATGDADVCFSAGEETYENKENVCAWWFYSGDGCSLELRRKTDNFYHITPSMKLFSGTNPQDISNLCIETRSRIRKYLNESKEGFFSADTGGSELSHDGQSEGKEDVPSSRQFPALLPAIPQFRMTRRLASTTELTEESMLKWDDTCIGMIGDWRKRGPRYCIPYQAICASKTTNLLVAGRCIPAKGTAWDITRVIPACAVTGQAAGTAAALLSGKEGASIRSIDIAYLQKTLIQQKVLFNRNLFIRRD